MLDLTLEQKRNRFKYFQERAKELGIEPGSEDWILLAFSLTDEYESHETVSNYLVQKEQEVKNEQIAALEAQLAELKP